MSKSISLSQLQKATWSRIELKDPVIYRENETSYVIRILKNVRGRIMCEMDFGSDKFMRQLESLPHIVHEAIDKRITA